MLLAVQVCVILPQAKPSLERALHGTVVMLGFSVHGVYDAPVATLSQPVGFLGWMSLPAVYTRCLASRASKARRRYLLDLVLCK